MIDVLLTTQVNQKPGLKKNSQGKVHWKQIHSGERKNLENSRKQSGSQFVMAVGNVVCFDWKVRKGNITRPMSYANYLMRQPVSVLII